MTEGGPAMYPVSEADRIAFLFEGWEHRIPRSYFQGYAGRAYANDPVCPTAAQIFVGSFCFLSGVPDEALVRNLPAEMPALLLMVPRQAAWCPLIERVYGARAVRIERYLTEEAPGLFDRARLRIYCEALPAGYRLMPIEELLYTETRKEEWSYDLTSQFPTYSQYKKYGLGFAVLWQGRPVAGASSYVRYDDGIEIEIDTAPAHRRKGLATACGARLILACLERGLYPCWDAHDLRSAALAGKLGYSVRHGYTTYQIQSL